MPDDLPLKQHPLTRLREILAAGDVTLDDDGLPASMCVDLIEDELAATRADERARTERDIAAAVRLWACSAVHLIEIDVAIDDLVDSIEESDYAKEPAGG